MVATGRDGGNGFAYWTSDGELAEFPLLKRIFNSPVKEISTTKGFAADKYDGNSAGKSFRTA